MPLWVLLLAAAPAAPAPADQLDRLVIEDPRPADSHHVDRYTCRDEGDRQVDVVVEYGTTSTSTSTSPTQHVSRVERLVIGDRTLTPAELERINAFAEYGTVTGSTAGCWSTGIRVAIEFFDPDRVPQGECLADALFYVRVVLDRRTGELKLPD